MIDINITLLIQLLNFLIALVGINYLLVKPIRAIIYQRQETIALAIENITTLKNQAKEELLQYELVIQETREKANRYYKTEQTKIAQIKTDLLIKANKETQQSLIETKNTLNTNAKDVQQSIQQYITSFAHTAMTKLLT